MDTATPNVESVVVPRVRDLGDGFTVRRALPAHQRQMVGPFIFFDQMGPAVFEERRGLDVRPHPHIGLATVTYLLQGEILHRDSLGTVQRIVPGEVNWMTAGRGIAHSERTAPERRVAGETLFGFQIWVALPTRHEETEPSFAHFAAGALPRVEASGVQLRMIAGALAGVRSPVPTLSEMFYADLHLAPGARFQLRPEHEDRAAYVVEGELQVDGARFGPGEMPIFRPGAELILSAASSTRLLLLGGAPLDGQRHIFWNFVSSSPERIEQAKEDWRAKRFAPVPQETEFIPLPGEEPAVPAYP